MTDDQTIPTGGWAGITDDAAAQWALGKLAAHTAERDRIRRNAQAEVERIQAKALDDERPVTDKIEWFEGELTGYLRRLRDADPTLKTYKLPSGNLAHRKGRTSTKVTDAAAFVEWAITAAPAALNVSPLVSVLTPAHGFIRTAEGTIVTADGEPVPGVEIVTAEDTYSVTLAPGGDA